MTAVMAYAFSAKTCSLLVLMIDLFFTGASEEKVSGKH